MIKFPEQYKKVNSKFKYKYMVVTVGNLLLDIPLSLPINYCKEFNLESKYWDIGTDYLMQC